MLMHDADDRGGEINMVMAVLIEFADDAKAKAFVEKVNGGYHAIEDDGPDVENGVRPPRFVVGIWKIPTKFCTCASEGVRMKIQGYTRGKKFGWWVHNICGKPSQFWVKARDVGLLWDGLGKNLLPGAPKVESPNGSGRTTSSTTTI
jgi:hypothetical protein